MASVEHGEKPADDSKETNLIVRNLAKSVTDDDLNAHFGGIGPLRKCFVVKDPASGKSKRFGFVHFALSAHAKCAIDSLHHSTLAGRRVTVESARHRVRVRDDGDDGINERSTKKIKLQNHSDAADNVGVATGDNNHGDGEAALCKQADPVSEPKRPKTEGKRKNKPESSNDDVKRALRQGSVPMRTVVLRKRDGSVITEETAKGAFSYVPGAEAAIEDVVLVDNGKEARVIFQKWTIAGRAAAKVHNEELDAVVDALRTGERTTAIIRNLPFRMSRKMVEDAFASVASVRNVRLAPPPPSRMSSKLESGCKVNGDTVVDCGGYAFVEFFTVSDTKHAISQKNGTEIGGRTVAVDMALTKSKYNHAQVMQRSEKPDIAAEPGSEQPSKDGDNGEGENDGENEDESEGKEDEGGKKAPESSAEELARTIFVRNLLFETKAHVVWTLMEQRFGAVEQAVIVKDKSTQVSKGKAFVKFAREEDARAAIRAADGVTEEVEKEGAQNGKLGKDRNTNGKGLWIDGRRVFVSMAMERNQAVAAQADRVKQKDGRNLHLASVGSVSRGSVEAKGLSDEDWAIRDTAERNKRVKLKKNPNTFVSDVRLCVLNLPRGMDEKILKAMFIEAAISDDGGTEDSEETKRNGSSRNRNDVRITHCAIVRDGMRKDRSKGFGFVTFEEHEHALRALQNVNNNARALEKFVIGKASKRLVKNEGVAEHLRQSWGRNRRLVVEFAVEDVRQVRVLEAIKKKGRQLREQHRLEKESGAPVEDAAGNGNVKLAGKRKRQSHLAGEGKTRARKIARHRKS